MTRAHTDTKPTQIPTLSKDAYTLQHLETGGMEKLEHGLAQLLLSIMQMTSA